MKRPTDNRIDDLITGLGSAETDELARLITAARHLLIERPTDPTAAEHLRQIARAVAQTDASQPIPDMKSLPVWRTVVNRSAAFALKVAAAATAVLTGTIGLAYAGVDLPGTAAERAFERVLGVELPNQAADSDHGRPDDPGQSEEEHGKPDDRGPSVEAHGKSSSDAVHAVKEGTDERGCEFGQAVAEAARQDAANENAGAEDPCDRDDQPGQSGEDHGKSNEPHGKSTEDHGKAGEDHGKADEPHGKADESHGKADESHGKADESHGKADEPHSKSDEEHGKSETANGSRATGQEHANENSTTEHEPNENSAQGQSHRPDNTD